MKQSAGILLYRTIGRSVEVLLVHPGGPFWVKKDLGAWSIPKGEFESDEKPQAAAQREFMEEIGSPPPKGDYTALGKFKQPSGKLVYAFALRSDFNLEHFHSEMFEMEWPPRSGQKQEFPENDKAAWLPLTTALQKIVRGQIPVLTALAETLQLDLTTAEGGQAQASLF